MRPKFWLGIAILLLDLLYAAAAIATADLPPHHWLSDFGLRLIGFGALYLAFRIAKELPSVWRERI